MIVEPAEVGARGVDSLPFSQGGTASEAMALKAEGIDFFVGYHTAMNTSRLSYILDAGLAFMPVTFGGSVAFDPGPSIRSLRALGIPSNTTVWLDLEGKFLLDQPAQYWISKIQAWHSAHATEGYNTGIYVGSPQPFTGPELYALPVTRYWCAPSKVLDRNGVEWAGPACGWCMRQDWPSKMWRQSGVFVDVDHIGQDYRSRVPNWVVAA